MQSLALFINALSSGLVLGSIYAVMSLGLTLIYGVGRLFNFAHGAFLIWGAYFTWYFYERLHVNYFISILLSIISILVISVIIERSMLFPLRKKPEYDYGITGLLVTLGLAIALSHAGDLIFGTRIKTIPKLADGFLRIGVFSMPYHDIAIMAFSIAILIALELFLVKTSLGTALRAVSQDQVGAKLVGINLEKLYSFTFALSVGLAGISGILLAPKLFIAPFVGWEALFKAVVIVIFGGLGSIKGTLVSAFLLGILEGFVAMYIGMFYVQPIWFVLLVTVLYLRPRGLFGQWA
jgi:branched-chain amino acid transport system permease protein